MGNLLRQNPVAFALAAIATLLVAIIAIEGTFGSRFWPAGSATATKPATPAEAKMVPPVAALVPDDAYPETASRPLFTPTRRPAPTAPSVASSMVKGQFILTGVLMVGDQRIALLREKTGGKVHRVEQGKDINGVTLSSIEPDKVTLSQGGDREEITLQAQKGVAAPAVAAAPVVPASGPFAPVGGAVPGQPVAAAPVAAPGNAPLQPPAQVTAQPGTQPPPAAANPAQRSGFGPFVNPPTATPSTNSSEATPMTPEELLARRRARRGQQQQPNQ